MRAYDASFKTIACDSVTVDPELKRVQLIPDGRVETTKGLVVVDRDGFARVQAAFKEHRTPLVIDWEHQTLGGQYSRPDGRAPAAGWIHELHYEPNQGIFADVEWLDESREAIRSGKYRFISPVVYTDGANGNLHAIKSAGLTNKPAIPGLQRLAASQRGEKVPQLDQISCTDGSDGALVAMICDSLHITPRGTVSGTLDAIRVSISKRKNQLMVLTGSIDPMLLIGEMAALLGVTVSSDINEALSAIRDAIKDKMPLASDGKDGGTKSIAASDRNDPVVTALRDENEGLRRSVLKQEIDAIFQPFILKGVLGREDDKARPGEYSRFMRLAMTDREACLLWLNERAAMLPMSGRKIDSNDGFGGGAPARGNRQAVIHRAEQVYDTEKALQKTTSKIAYVENALREAGIGGLTPDEQKQYRVTVL